MHPDHEAFTSGITACKKVFLTFLSKEDSGLSVIRTCAPMDYGPSRRTTDRSARYHLWDYDSDGSRGPHTLSLLPEQVVSIEDTDDHFRPVEFITWPPPYRWFYARNWGEFS
jgi:hypothetical protein